MQFAKYRDFYGGERAQAARGDGPSWRADVVRKIVAFTEFPEGWDSYSGLPLRWDVAQFALTALNEITQPRTPAPDVVLAPDGSVQFEWHQKAIDLEVCITAPFACEVFFHDRRTGQQFCEELSNDFTRLAAPMTELTVR